MSENRISTLVVEDSEVDLWLINFMLKKISDVDVLGTAKNGDLGLELITSLVPQLAFLDLDLPGKSGLDLAKIIKDQNLDVSIVFITAFEQLSDEISEFKPFDYLVKPITLDILKDVVERYRESKFSEA